jgi:cytoskeletal protein CcmA (bactofilin family)
MIIKRLRKMGEKGNQVNLTIIGEGMELTGELCSADDIRIDGTFVGDLHTNGKIVVSKKGFVSGIIKAHNVTIQGRGKGEFEAENSFQISPGGYLEGSVKTKYMNITESAFFHGTCNISRGENLSGSASRGKILSLGMNLQKSNTVNPADNAKVKKKLSHKQDDEQRKHEDTLDSQNWKSKKKSIINNKISQIKSL